MKNTKLKNLWGSLKYSLCYFLPKKLLIFAVIAILALPILTVERSEIIASQNSFVQNIFWIFQGNSLLERRTHIGWLFLHVMILFSVCGLPVRKSFEFDSKTLMLSGNRWTWWLGRCVTNWMIVTIDYLLLLSVIFVYCILAGGNFAAFSELDWVILIFPYLALVTYSFVQTALSTVIAPAFSFLSMMVMVFASISIQSYLFIGNYSMLLRNSAVVFTGLNVWALLAIMLSLTAISILIGGIAVNNKDVVK